jgi:carbonic anhydrase
MSLIEHAIAASRKTAERHDPSLANKPAPKLQSSLVWTLA